MIIRSTAAALSILLLAFAAPAAKPARAAGSSSDLISAVKNVSSETDKYRSLMANFTADEFHFVDAQSVLSPSQKTAYETALSKNKSAIADLQYTLEHTTLTGSDGVITTLARLMKAQNLTIDQVVGVYVAANGAITLFYR